MELLFLIVWILFFVWHVMLLQILFKNIINYFCNDYIYQNALTAKTIVLL